nr:MAG TPA: Spore cortex-lytic enzyme, lytic transglycosylase [Caudoviricetes sp.]
MSDKQIDLTFVKMVNETYDRQKQIYKKECREYAKMCILTIITLLACTYLIARILYNPTTDYTVESQESQQAEYTYNPYIENLTHEEINIDSNYTDNMEYFVRCVTAEAGNQDDYGKRLVIDVILNSCDKYNMTTTDVINADGRIRNILNQEYIGKMYQ